VELEFFSERFEAAPESADDFVAQDHASFVNGQPDQKAGASRLACVDQSVQVVGTSLLAESVDKGLEGEPGLR
jgi:hypothetical protein